MELMSLQSDNTEYLFKVLIVGDIGTGKTSLIKRYVHNIFSMHYKSTIGVDFALKVINWDENTTIRLQLWDIAGQERFGNMTRVYYREAVAAFVVFDVTRVSTFEAVEKWANDIKSKVFLADDKPIPMILLANKCDLANDQGPYQQWKSYAENNGFIKLFMTSAKDNIGIDDAGTCLVENILLNNTSIQKPKYKRNDLVQYPEQPVKKNSNCCI